MSTAEPVTRSDGAKESGRETTKTSSRPGEELDVSKLHSLASEQQELCLFSFISVFERYVFSLSPASLKERQSDIKKELFKIITLSTPSPTRPIRRCLGRCFGQIFENGDRRLLFESITELGDTLSIGKAEKDIKNKQAAVYCLGEIYRAAGDGAINVSSSICAALIRLYKSASNYVALRATIFRTLGQIVRGTSGSLDESVAREVWKQARNAASNDRGGLVQLNACWCLEQLVAITNLFNNSLEFDTLKTTIWKVGDSSIPVVRHAAASCLSAMLVRGYSETGSVVPLPKTPRTPKPKKVKRATMSTLTVDDEDDVDAMRLASPGWKKKSLELELTMTDILKQLSAQYTRFSTSNRTRAMIIACYVKIFKKLEPRIIENNYSQIADHLLVEVLSNAAISHHRYRLLITRRFVQKLLADIIGQQVLGEAAQLAAANVLINDILKNYPSVMKDQPQPSKNTLTGALNALSSLIESLSSAFSPAASACREALMQVLQHPSYTVQIHAAHCLRLFVVACPHRLIECASICMNNVTRELSLLNTSRHSARNCVGYANGLAAVLSTSSLQPLYASIEINARVLRQAIDLLKTSGAAELRISGTQVQVAWILIGGLMSLGPSFVKIHLNQLLLLWRNALPKPLPAETFSQRSLADISFLAHVRECALGCILSFLETNGRLLTTDISRRIAILLQHTVEFLRDLPVPKSEPDFVPRIHASLQLPDLIQMVRRRVLQCFTRLAIRNPHSSKEILSQAGLISFTATCFSDPEWPQTSLGASIASSAGNFESIWGVADNVGYGVSGSMRALDIRRLPGEQKQTLTGRRQRQVEFMDVDLLLLSPVCGAREHDSVYLASAERGGLEDLPNSPGTEVVNSAIVLFAMALPLQSPKVQESMIEQLSGILSSKFLAKDPARKMAVTVNITLALLGALKVHLGELPALAGDLRATSVERALEELLKTLIMDPDQYVRNAACEALGRLCNGASNTFTSTLVANLVDTIVVNRDPHARAGCALSLGAIYSNIGGMSAGLHLRKIHSILMPLCSDPHHTVHFWAIEALSRIAEASGLNFSTYLPSSLGLAAQIWLSDRHSDEADVVATANSELELPTTVAIANNVASLIDVLGPDLQDMSKVRDLILNLVRQFDLDDLAAVKAETLRCWEHIYLYSPRHVDFHRYIQQLQAGLVDDEPTVHAASITGLFSLVQKNSAKVMELAGAGIEDQLWAVLDRPSDQTVMRSMIWSWLGQTSLSDTSKWISTCSGILTKTVVKKLEQPPKGKNATEAIADQQAAGAALDEEVAGFNVSTAKDDESGAVAVGQEMLRWQVRMFALECLSEVFSDGARHSQKYSRSPAGMILQNRVADIIRMAFLASTSSVIELRVGGLKLINQVLILFGRTPDPDFSEALLLEQYQAQISSALTPAFGTDSSPELASAAINVCATFISTGLVTDLDRMGRILKLLVSTLQSFTVQSSDPAIGDLKGLSSNAQRMVKMAVLSAWADLQVNSLDQQYLVDVVKPHISSLTPLWLESLQDFARLRFEPDISSTMGVNMSDSLDTIYAALNRETLLKFYQASWLKIVNAVASLINSDGLDALENRHEDQELSTIQYRAEPAAFFFVLFGVSFEALATLSGSEAAAEKDQKLDIILALRKILQPSITGSAIYQDAVFGEATDLFDRLAQTEGFAIQRAIVDLVRNLCLSHPSTRSQHQSQDTLGEDIEQLFELARIIFLVLAGVLPNISGHAGSDRNALSGEAIALVVFSLDALVDASAVFPSVIRSDLHACILHIFTTILGTAACQTTVVPGILPTFKRFVQSVANDSAEDSASPHQLRRCLYRFRTILANAQRRESDASLLCARNTLIFSVVLLSEGSCAFEPNEEILEQLLDDLLDCVEDVGLGRVAANCLHSILQLESNDCPTTTSLAEYLLPLLIHFLVDESRQDPEGARSIILQALIARVNNAQDVAAPAALSLVLPLILHQSTLREDEELSELSRQLLSLASHNPLAFRAVVAKMGQEQKSRMEHIIKAGGGVGRDDSARELANREEPSIALKLNFGGR